MNKPRQTGFTIIELSLATAFISVLLIIILFGIIQIVGSYNKGSALKRVNQSGRSIGAELQRSLKESVPSSVTIPAAVRQRACLGTYSYAWNIGTVQTNRYSGGDTTPIGFIRVRDPARAVCTPATSLIAKANAVELLGDGLVMRRVVFNASGTLASATSGDSFGLFTVDYTLSTPDDDLLVAGTRDACLAGQDQQFCALNRFSITAYARGY